MDAPKIEGSPPSWSREIFYSGVWEPAHTDSHLLGYELLFLALHSVRSRGNLKLAVLGIFVPQKAADATHPGFPQLWRVIFTSSTGFICSTCFLAVGSTNSAL